MNTVATASPRTRGPLQGTPEDPATTVRARTLWWDLAGLTVLAAALRLHQLDEQLWLDEIAATMHSFRRSFGSIVTESASFVSHPLYELMASASLRTFGEHAWSVRLPAAVFGTLSVPLLYLLVRRLAPRGEAFLAAGILAVSAHHVFFSQDARGYTVMLFFLLAATLLLLRLPEGLSFRTGAAYAGAAVLGAYAIPFGVAITAGHAAASLPATLAWRRGRRGPRLGVLAFMFAVTGTLIGLLYLPLLIHTVSFAASEAGGAGLGLFGMELWRNLQAALGGTPGVLVAIAVGTVGLVHYARRQPYALALLVGPVLANAAVLIALRVQIHPRYLIIALPAGIVITARGLTAVWQQAAGRLPERRRVQAAVVSLVFVLGVAAGAGLPYYYAHPRQDFLGALDLLDRLAEPGDEAVALAPAGHAIDDYYRPGFPTVSDLDDLLAVEDGATRVWVITSLERVVAHHGTDLLERLWRDYELVDVLPGTIDDGDMRLYVRDVPAASITGANA